MMNIILIISIVVNCFCACANYLAPKVYYREEVKEITWRIYSDPLIHLPLRFEYDKGRTSLILVQVDYPERKKKNKDKK
jgi:hypothetical protein